MKKYSTVFIIINLILILGYFNYQVYHNNKTLDKGALILLELTPVDPRSMLQGDYMQLNYALSRSLSNDSLKAQGYLIVKPGANGVAILTRTQNDVQPLSAGELALKYNLQKSGSVKIGSETFFFEEGKAEQLQKAKFGGLRIDELGKSFVVGLYDEKYKLIK